MSFPIVLIFDFREQVEVILVSVFADPPFFEGIFDRTMGLISVGAVGKFTFFGEGKKLSEVVGDVHHFEVVEAQGFDARCVDDLASHVEVVHFSKGSGMLSFA